MLMEKNKYNQKTKKRQRSSSLPKNSRHTSRLAKKKKIRKSLNLLNTQAAEFNSICRRADVLISFAVVISKVNKRQETRERPRSKDIYCYIGVYIHTYMYIPPDPARERGVCDRC